MADAVSDEKFKEEILRLVRAVTLKVGENAKEIAFLRTDVDTNTREFKKLRKEIRASLGFNNDYRFRVLELYNRLWEIEAQAKAIAVKFPFLKEEYDLVCAETLKMFTEIEENPDAKIQLDELDVRVENLEEKVFA